MFIYIIVLKEKKVIIMILEFFVGMVREIVILFIEIVKA